MELLSNPAAIARITDLSRQIESVFMEEQQRWRSMCCTLCGDKHCLRNVRGFSEDAPRLCLKHGAAWNLCYVKSNHQLSTTLLFARWLARVIVNEARRLEAA